MLRDASHELVDASFRRLVPSCRVPSRTLGILAVGTPQCWNFSNDSGTRAGRIGAASHCSLTWLEAIRRVPHAKALAKDE